jgi:hypothetical protein
MNSQYEMVQVQISYTNKTGIDSQYGGMGRSSAYDFQLEKWKYAVK